MRQRVGSAKFLFTGNSQTKPMICFVRYTASIRRNVGDISFELKMMMLTKSSRLCEDISKKTVRTGEAWSATNGRGLLIEQSIILCCSASKDRHINQRSIYKFMTIAEKVQLVIFNMHLNWELQAFLVKRKKRRKTALVFHT